MVGGQTRRWVAGKALVLDDSYVHAVWNEVDGSPRVLLLFDIWHPDVKREERQKIEDMFRFAADKGWISDDEKP